MICKEKVENFRNHPVFLSFSDCDNLRSFASAIILIVADIYVYSGKHIYTPW
ncbi:hypothetical protein JCM10003_3735 [Bacteroides pyogenes JCM 10003]|nr:hypothetical protein JCM10003_3735 [Bacteroides pyogenes JCM 10003]